MYLKQPIPSGDAFRGLARPAVGRMREIFCGLELLRLGGRGPLAVFLPSTSRQGSAHLRMYNMAEALRGLGWRTFVLSSKLGLAQRLRLLARLDPDILVMQGARHPLNRPRLYPGWPIVFDMDDADFHLPHLAAPVERAMADVTAVLAGSVYVADWCKRAGAAEAHVVWTGTPVSTRPRPSQLRRPAVIAWAQSRPMTYTREADWVRDVIAGIAARQPGVTFRIFDRRKGDDAAFADSFRAAGLRVEWAPSRQYRDYLASFDDVAIGLAPLCPDNAFSRGKSFGKVLAYLDARVPVIASDLGEHAAFFSERTGVVSNDRDTWVHEACRLLSDHGARAAMADAAYDDYVRRLSIGAAAARVDGILRSLIARRKINIM